jgi:cyclophilin family peptidyl-prolyl cis-trans isomerase
MKVRFFILLVLTSITAVSFAENPQVTLQISGAVNGSIVVELYADKAPVTTLNFINYVKSGFYNGLIFHRVIYDFVIQGGGYDANLVLKTPGSPIINESSNGLSNVRGTIAMARTKFPNSAASQFFINHVDNTYLDYGSITYPIGSSEPYIKVGYCVFGSVISGMDVVDAIAELLTTTENGMADVPINDVIIQNASVTLDVPVCIEKLEGDIDGDCDVDFADFAMLAANWLECNSVTAACN